MTEQEKILNNALMTTFSGNMHFLSQYDNRLYTRILDLNNAIGNGAYDERYFLEFIKENGDFDIYDSQNKTYLYNKKPKQWNNKAVTNTNFDLSSSINPLNPEFYQKRINNLTGDDLSVEVYKLNNIRVNNFYQQITQIIPNNLYDKTKKVRRINKFLFIGTLLGRHIPKILQKINSRDHFVCEPNLEIFRLSLFVTDYSLLARDGKSVVFAIMEDDENFLEKFEIFYRNDIINNSFFKFYSTDVNVGKMFDVLFSAVYNDDPFGFNFCMMLFETTKSHIKNLKEHKTINFIKPFVFKSRLQKLPILFLGAGPSLGQNIKWLEENQNHFIIVAMAATLKRLEKHNIKPDIITSLDPQHFIANSQFGINLDFIKDCIKLISTNSHEKLFEKLDRFKESNLYLFETMNTFLKDNTKIVGKSIGEATLMVLLLLKAKDIYLLGTDLALNQLTGSTHDESHYSSKNTHSLEKGQNLDTKTRTSFSLNEDLVETRGNLCQRVVTTRLFYASLIEYQNIIAKYKTSSTNIYNLCTQGAYVHGTTPLDIKDLNADLLYKIDKSNLSKELSNYFDIISEFELKGSEVANLSNQIELLSKALKFLEEQSQNIDSHQRFKTIVIEFNEIISSYEMFFNGIFYNYYMIINRYIDFYYNDRELKDESKTIKDVSYIWISQIKLLIHTYMSYLKQLIPK